MDQEIKSDGKEEDRESGYGIRQRIIPNKEGSQNTDFTVEVNMY